MDLPYINNTQPMHATTMSNSCALCVLFLISAATFRIAHGWTTTTTTTSFFLSRPVVAYQALFFQRESCTRRRTRRRGCFGSNVAAGVSEPETADKGIPVEQQDNDSYSWDFGFGQASLAGTDPDRPQKVNQDGCFIRQGSSLESITDDAETIHGGAASSSPLTTPLQVLCVMDGHGLKGHLVVQYLQRQLPKLLSKRLHTNLVVPESYGSNSSNSSSNSGIGDLTSHDDMDDDDFDSDNVTWRVEQQWNDMVRLGRIANETHATDATGSGSGSGSGSVAAALTDSFLAAQRCLLHTKTNNQTLVPASRSGTTCIVSVVTTASSDDATTTETTMASSSTVSSTTLAPLHVYTAAVGDSRAIVISVRHRRQSNPTRTDVWTVQPLTTPTTVQAMPTERYRINQCECEGARIDSSGNVFYGPVGIAMTRSLGNTVMLRAGVVPLPIVTRHVLTPPTIDEDNDSQPPSNNGSTMSYFVCAGTDGVFDVLSHDDIVEILKATIVSNQSLNDAAAEICRLARLAWLAGLPIETKVDDATFVILQCSVRNRKS
jgi:serine/threonine protein phosphatase PrpC